MMIYSISNQKGGVGKSTTANALGAALFRKGFRVLYVDLDAQGNLSHSMKAGSREITSLEVLTAAAAAEDAVIETGQGDLIPSGPALAGADAILTDTGKEYRLKEALDPISDKYDYCIIDTPPALGTLTVNALTACNGVIIAAQADIYSLQGIGQLSRTIQTVKRYCNNDLHIMGMVITRYNSRAVLTKDMTAMIEDTAKQLHTKVYASKIRECVQIKEAQAKQTDIFRYAPKSNGAKDYEALAEEVLRR